MDIPNTESAALSTDPAAPTKVEKLVRTVLGTGNRGRNRAGSGGGGPKANALRKPLHNRSLESLAKAASNVPPQLANSPTSDATSRDRAGVAAVEAGADARPSVSSAPAAAGGAKVVSDNGGAAAGKEGGGGGAGAGSGGGGGGGAPAEIVRVSDAAGDSREGEGGADAEVRHLTS